MFFVNVKIAGGIVHQTHLLPFREHIHRATDRPNYTRERHPKKLLKKQFYLNGQVTVTGLMTPKGSYSLPRKLETVRFVIGLASGEHLMGAQRYSTPTK